MENISTFASEEAPVQVPRRWRGMRVIVILDSDYKKLVQKMEELDSMDSRDELVELKKKRKWTVDRGGG